jgi:hypothetical protein
MSQVFTIDLFTCHFNIPLRILFVIVTFLHGLVAYKNVWMIKAWLRYWYCLCITIIRDETFFLLYFNQSRQYLYHGIPSYTVKQSNTKCEIVSPFSSENYGINDL